MISAGGAAVLIGRRCGIVRRMSGEVTHARRRAAALVWLTGCVEIGLFGSCAVGVHRADAWTEQALAMTAVLGLAPGLIYLVLGLGVQAGKIAAVYGALLLTLTQALVLIAAVASAAAGAFAQGDPLALTLAMVLPGSLLGLVVATIWRLWQALNAPGRPHEG